MKEQLYHSVTPPTGGYAVKGRIKKKTRYKTEWCPNGCGKKVVFEVFFKQYICKNCGAIANNRKEYDDLLEKNGYM